MSEQFIKNANIFISDRSHLNLTLNIYHCGNHDICPQDCFPLTNPDMFTLIYINSGKAVLENDHIAVKLTASQGYVAFSNVAYNLKNIGEEYMNVTWVAFSGYLVEEYLNRANITVNRPVIDDRDEGCVGENINKLYMKSHRLPNRYCKMASILYDIFAYLLDKNPTKSMGVSSDNSDYFAIKAVDYIERNYSRSITVDEVASRLGITRKHLYHVFNYTLNISPKQYIINYRIGKACIRLRDTTQTIAEIAEAIGYINQFYFAKEFKRLTGLTPTQYRNCPVELKLFEYRLPVPELERKFSSQQTEINED